MSQQELVLAAKQGSAAAFAELYEAIYRDLYRFAFYLLKDEQDAQDAVSDAVVDAFAGIGKLRKAESFRSWMFKIVSVKCKRKLKSYVLRNKQIDIDEAVLPTEELLDDSVELKRAFAQLSDEERMILSLSVFGGYNSAEVAEILHLNRNTVRSKQSRALAKMRSLLDMPERKEAPCYETV